MYSSIVYPFLHLNVWRFTKHSVKPQQAIFITTTGREDWHQQALLRLPPLGLLGLLGLPWLEKGCLFWAIGELLPTDP